MGLWVDNELKWKMHINTLENKLSLGINAV